jgi:WhiB family redox-sensing transcriptional regulator
VVTSQINKADSLALCQGTNQSLFFSTDCEDVNKAKKLCMQCPRKVQCFQEAIDGDLTYGIWGGHLFRAGRIIIGVRSLSYRPVNSYLKSKDHISPDYPVPEQYLDRVSYAKAHRTKLSLLAMNFSLN